MLITIMIILGVVGLILFMIGAEDGNDGMAWSGLIMMLIAVTILIFRMLQWICKSSKDRRNTSRCYNCC